jgi:hypothetical protein
MTGIRRYMNGLRVSLTEMSPYRIGVTGRQTELPREMTRIILSLTAISRHLTEITRRLTAVILRMNAVR